MSQIFIKNIDESKYPLFNNTRNTLFKRKYNGNNPFFTNIKKTERQYSFSSLPTFSNKVNIILNDDYDMLYEIMLSIRLPELKEKENTFYAWSPEIGYRLIKRLNVIINGVVYEDTNYQVLRIMKKIGNDQQFDSMTGNIEELFKFTKSKKERTLYIPLKLWFNEMSLPIFLFEGKIEVSIDIADIEDCLLIGPTREIEVEESLTNFKMGDIIYQDEGNKSGYFMNLNNGKMYYIPISSHFLYSPNEEIPLERDKYSIFTKNNSVSLYPIGENKKIDKSQIYQDIELENVTLLITYVTISQEERELFFKKTKNYQFDIKENRYNLKEIKSTDPRNLIRYQITIPKLLNNRKFFNRQGTINLNLDDRVKTIYWLVYYDNIFNDFSYVDDYNGNFICQSSQLIIGNNEITNIRDNRYYSDTKELNHFITPIPGLMLYTFSLEPLLNIPTGHNNLTNKNVSLNLNFNERVNKSNPVNVLVFAHIYDIIQINDNLIKLLFKYE